MNASKTAIETHSRTKNRQDKGIEIPRACRGRAEAARPNPLKRMALEKRTQNRRRSLPACFSARLSGQLPQAGDVPFLDMCAKTIHQKTAGESKPARADLNSPAVYRSVSYPALRALLRSNFSQKTPESPIITGFLVPLRLYLQSASNEPAPRYSAFFSISGPSQTVCE